MTSKIKPVKAWCVYRTGFKSDYFGMQIHTDRSECVRWLKNSIDLETADGSEKIIPVLITPIESKSVKGKKK